MKLLKVLFVLELALGILWVIRMTLTEDPGLGALLMLIWTCRLHLIFMVIGVYFLVERP